mgnify:CR=1 FL=1
MSLIKIENASLGYEGKTVVNDISVDIKEKDYICIVAVSYTHLTLPTIA